MTVGRDPTNGILHLHLDLALLDPDVAESRLGSLELACGIIHGPAGVTYRLLERVGVRLGERRPVPEPRRPGNGTLSYLFVASVEGLDPELHDIERLGGPHGLGQAALDGAQLRGELLLPGGKVPLALGGRREPELGAGELVREFPLLARGRQAIGVCPLESVGKVRDALLRLAREPPVILHLGSGLCRTLPCGPAALGDLSLLKASLP